LGVGGGEGMSNYLCGGCLGCSFCEEGQKPITEKKPELLKVKLGELMFPKKLVNQRVNSYGMTRIS